MIYLCYFFSIQNFFHFLTEISLEVTDEKFRADLNYKKLLDTKFLHFVTEISLDVTR